MQLSFNSLPRIAKLMGFVVLFGHCHRICILSRCLFFFRLFISSATRFHMKYGIDNTNCLFGGCLNFACILNLISFLSCFWLVHWVVIFFFVNLVHLVGDICTVHLTADQISTTDSTVTPVRVSCFFPLM